jgi:hypothetical protein
METQKSVLDTLESVTYFPSTVYAINKPEFIPTVLPVFDEAVAKQEAIRKISKLYPSVMTERLDTDARLSAFSIYILGTCFNILAGQGYKMDDKMPVFHSMWGQQHYKGSSMDQHIHNEGTLINGFYFLECPKDSPQIVLYDPRPGKVQGSLTEANPAALTEASNHVVMNAAPGVMLFTNSWLPHSFSRHSNKKPFKFIHFNVTTEKLPAFQGATVI